jgi:exportin-1
MGFVCQMLFMLELTLNDFVQLLIEKQLTYIKEREDSWQLAKDCLDNSQNEFVQWFGVSTLEYVVQRRWEVLPLELKNGLRSYLFQFLANTPPDYRRFVLKQLCKLLVMIGKLDWPHLAPDFFENVMQFIHTPETRYDYKDFYSRLLRYQLTNTLKL